MIAVDAPSPEVPSKVPTEALEAFIDHLRHHPEDSGQSSARLAERFNLPVDFVREVLAGLRRPVSHENTWRLNISLDWLKATYEQAERTFDRITERTGTFVVGSIGVVTIVFVLVLVATASFGSSLNSFRFVYTGFGAFLFLGTFVAHMVCFMRKAMARYPLYGAVTLWVLFTILFGAAYIAGGETRAESKNFAPFIVVPFLAGIIGLTYGVVGVAISIIGGFTRLKWQEFREEHMTRQQMLERYFELESRLERGRRMRIRPQTWMNWPAFRLFRRRPGITALLIGMVWTGSQALFDRATGGAVAPDIRMSTTDAIMILGGSLFSLGGSLSLVLIGYLSKQTRTALSYATVYAIGAVGIRVVLLDPPMVDPGFWSRMWACVSTFIAAGVFASFGAFGSRVQEQSKRTLRLQRNDQAMVVAEMLRIQWRLEDQSHDPCVMSVDAARSSQMKTDADPLEVEFSFRQYQEWIEDIVGQFNGAVHSRAGDGAVVSFPNCPSGFEAARRIQTDIARFNAEVNRLEMPFRLRVGLHTGHVSGELDEVEYVDVIDIAAHVQGVAPIGGIAMTDAVASKLPQEELVPLAKEIDNRRVFLALNPTED